MALFAGHFPSGVVYEATIFDKLFVGMRYNRAATLRRRFPYRRCNASGLHIIGNFWDLSIITKAAESRVVSAYF